MPLSHHQQTVIDTIQLDLDSYSHLLELLEQQQQLILSRDHQGLSETAQAITTLILEARSNRQTRSQSMAHLNLENTRTGMAQFIQQLRHDNKQEITEDWEELMDIMEECQQINRINDQALKMQNAAAEKILNQLPLQGTSSKTYSSKGQEQTSSRSVLNTQA